MTLTQVPFEKLNVTHVLANTTAMKVSPRFIQIADTYKPLINKYQSLLFYACI